MPLLSSDSTDGFPMRRSLLKTGSLDRHLILSPGDLFESKIGNRVPSSLTSLSTPSFRIRPETKGPCYMGLCVPSDFGAIFLTDIPLHVRSVQEEEEEKPLKLGDSFEFHSLSNCLGCYKVGKDGKLDMTSDHEDLNVEGVTEELEATSLESLAASLGEGEDNSVVIRKEALRLVSNLICCVGSKANEQGLLRLKQKFPWSFNDLCLYTEFCLVMSKYNMRLPLRRFLQELFYDHPFQKFYDVAAQILGEEEIQVQEAN